ncbi:MAG: Peptidyl-prolyl cis-trans isomerase [uncultured Solirubrobacteraceae bacterium]|uniref:Peptidyl-prolyl cis-trans isomerase n=1 Tax=uncultured Solirubrobacteraceae bacterium TaxID=1162706 RepID=A0A6J4SRI9_9ACTN|nr:MAG: Peptidyl-prolyl cis-trans isomerase [uncultured Solirubrobacteraceae bacterium]
MLRTSLLIAFLMLLLGLAGCGGDEDEGAAATAPATTDTGCEVVAEPEPRGPQSLEAPEGELDPEKTHVATVATSCGTFEITLDVEAAPVTTASFAHLVEQDFYDGLTFHRVSRGFVIQGGDPLGDGNGGPGYQVRESPPASLAYEKGVVAMAKRADEPAGASGSQFFVVTETTDLAPDYALLGRVTSGMEAVERIAASEVDNFEKPREPVVIRDIGIRTR